MKLADKSDFQYYRFLLKARKNLRFNQELQLPHPDRLERFIRTAELCSEAIALLQYIYESDAVFTEKSHEFNLDLDQKTQKILKKAGKL